MHKFVEEFTDRMIKDTIKNDKIFGVDQYNNQKLEYPECYSKFLISLYYKNKIHKDEVYKEYAKKYIEYMLNLANETDDYIYWGLPYNWGETKVEDGFLLTTAFCLKSLCLWYKEGVFTDEKIIQKVINWCMALLHNNNDDEYGFYYSKKLKQNIYNATSIACGVLATNNEFLSPIESKKLEKVISTLIKVQKSGYWNYSSVKVDVDLLHQCYTCEGIFEYYNKTKNEIALNSATSGIDFLIQNEKFINIERYLFNLSDPEKFNVRFKYLLLKMYSKTRENEKRFTKTRAWSYGAYVRTLIYSYYFTNNRKYKTRLEEILIHVEKNIIKDGNVLFQSGGNNVYVRNSYHLLESLCLFEYFNTTGEIE